MLVAIDPHQLRNVVGGQAVVEIDAPAGAVVSVSGAQLKRYVNGTLIPSQPAATAAADDND